MGEGPSSFCCFLKTFVAVCNGMLMKYWNALLLIVLIGMGHSMFCVSAQAQLFTNIRATQTQSVRAIIQSESGVVWYGSGKTLYAFDGKGIRAYDSELFNGMGAIGHLLEDSDGNIMVGCERGLVLFNQKDESFSLDERFKGENVRGIAEYGDDEWIGTSKGLYHNGELVEGGMNVFSLVRIGDEVVVASDEHLKVYDAKTLKLKRENDQSESIITCLSKDADGRVMAGSIHSVMRYDKGRNVMDVVSDELPVVKCMMLDARGKLIVGCDGGLYEIGKEVKHIVHDARNVRSLAGNVVWCMMKDRLGNTWIGTDNGLSVMSATQDFCVYPLYSITESGNGNQLYCMLHDSKNRLWMGGSNGIVKVENFGKSAQTYSWYEMNSEVHPIPHNRIRLFYEDPLWGVWACTDGGLLHYDEDLKEWTRYVIEGDENNWIYNVDREAEALVVTTYNSVYRVKYDAENKVVDVLQEIDAKPCLDNRYSEISIGDTRLAVSANGLTVSCDGVVKEIELPEKFVSIYYNADKDLVYLGGADVFAVTTTEYLLHQDKSNIWFDADARFVGEDKDSTLKKVLIVGMVCAIVALVLVLVMYFIQQGRMKTERARRKAMLKSAREKMTRLENDKTSLQHQLHLQQLAVQSQAGRDEGCEATENMNPDDLFIVQVNRMIEENMDNPELSVTFLSEKMGISSKQLYRKVKQCTDLTAVEYIRKLRLQKAALLLKNPEFTINEVMYMVGFSNPSYFSRSFATEYGMPPSEWRT